MQKQNRLWLIALGLSVLMMALTPIAVFPQGAGLTTVINDIDWRGLPDNIRVLVSVSDGNGVPVAGLTHADFQVQEDTHLVPVTAVQPADLPISVCLVIDRSGSMGNVSGLSGRPVISDTLDLARGFVGQLGTKDQACIVAFSGSISTVTPLLYDPQKEQPFSDPSTVLKFINSIQVDVTRPAATPLYDAILKAVKMTAAQPLGRRAIIVFAGGRDMALDKDEVRILPGSLALADDPITAAKSAQIPIFTIGMGDDFDQSYLQRLADGTGGRSQSRPEQLGKLFQYLTAQLRSQYWVNSDSHLLPDGKEHTLLIRARAGNAESQVRRTFKPDIPADAPIVMLYYKYGEENRRISAKEPPEVKGWVNVVPDIAASTVISRTDYYVNGRLAYSAIVPPWSFSWDTGQLSTGVYTLTVQAQDKQGKLGRATTVPVRVLGLSFFDVVSGIPMEVKLGIGMVALLAVIIIGVAGLRLRRSPALCPRGLHVMPPGAIECPFCAEENRARLEAAGERVPGHPPVANTIAVAEGIDGESAEPLKTQFLGRVEPEPALLAFLVMESGDHPGQHFTLDTDSAGTTIGRAGTNDVILDDPTVSRQHARIKLEGKEYYLYDLAGTNPSRVNYIEVKGRQKLKDNDHIEVGKVALVFKRVGS